MDWTGYSIFMALVLVVAGGVVTMLCSGRSPSSSSAAPVVAAPRHPHVLFQTASGRSGRHREHASAFPDTLPKSEVLELVRSFGEGRRAAGDEFVEGRHTEGAFFYASGHAHAGIRVWGAEDDWALSVFSAAQVNLRAGLALYQYVARWRASAGSGAPYVVQDGQLASIMCEQYFQGSQFADSWSAGLMLTSTVDLVAERAQMVVRDLAHRGEGLPFTARDEVGLALLLGWWEMTPRT